MSEAEERAQLWLETAKLYFEHGMEQQVWVALLLWAEAA